MNVLRRSVPKACPVASCGRGGYQFRGSLSGKEHELVARARRFAEIAHRGQKRKISGLPYVVHPLGVAELLARCGCESELIVAGLLHDTVEDTAVDINEIEREFGAAVASLVACVTDPRDLSAWKERKKRMKAAHTSEVEARRAETQRRNAAARWSWDPSSQPEWLNEEAYTQRIQPLLAKTTTSAISSALGVSWVYAKYIRLGQRRPHPRHWQKLAELAGVSTG